MVWYVHGSQQLAVTFTTSKEICPTEKIWKSQRIEAWVARRHQVEKKLAGVWGEEWERQKYQKNLDLLESQRLDWKGIMIIYKHRIISSVQHELLYVCKSVLTSVFWSIHPPFYFFFPLLFHITLLYLNLLIVSLVEKWHFLFVHYFTSLPCLSALQ